MGDLPNGHPGCLVASYVYQDYLFSQDVRDMTTEGHRIWRRRFRERLDRIAERYPPRIEVSLDDMADMLSSVADGGIILSKVLKDNSALARQVTGFRWRPAGPEEVPNVVTPTPFDRVAMDIRRIREATGFQPRFADLDEAVSDWLASAAAES